MPSPAPGATVIGVGHEAVTHRSYIKTTMLAGLIAVSLGGWLLHLRVHAPAARESNWLPFVIGICAVAAVPLLLAFRRTLHYGYVLNGIFVIIGTITMAHFSLTKLPTPLTFESLLLKTTLADIVILWSKLFFGKAIFDLETFGYDGQHRHAGKWWRYPHLGWWAIHMAGISAVYCAGVLIWG